MKILRILGFSAALALGLAAHAADVKISALPAGTTLAGTEPIPTVQSATTVATTPSAVLTYVNSTQTSANIISHWSGTCSVSTVLLGNGACGTSPGLPSSANPSATIGLSAVNGSATTFMTSDSAPPLSQAITPVWTGIHEWSLAEPRLLLNQTGAGADLKLWDIDVASGVLTMRTRTDADGAGLNWLAVTRGTITNVSNLTFGNTTSNPTYTWLGSGTYTFGSGTATFVNAQGTQFKGTGTTTGLNSAIVGVSSSPSLGWDETDQGADLKMWGFQANGAVLTLSTDTDANAVGLAALTVTRGTTTNITDISVGNATSNPTFHSLGTGTASFSGNIAGLGAIVASSANPPLRWQETDQGTDLKNWSQQVDGAVWTFNTLSDTLTPGSNIMVVTRGTTTNVSNIALGNTTSNPTFSILGSGVFTFGTGNVAVANSTAVGSYRAAATGVGGLGSGLIASSASPAIGWNETDQGTDLKSWGMYANGAVLTLQTVTDASASGSNIMVATRGATTALSNLTFGNATDNNTTTFAGSGTTTFNNDIVASSTHGITAGGTMGAARFSLAGTTGTLPGVGIYSAAANSLNFSTLSTNRGNFDAAGNFNVLSGIVSAGTKFTTSGCSVSATTGGATAGTFTLGVNACSVVITLAGASGSTAPNGWTCQAHNRVASPITLGESASTTTTATIPIPVTVGATDVVSFSCVGF